MGTDIVFVDGKYRNFYNGAQIKKFTESNRIEFKNFEHVMISKDQLHKHNLDVVHSECDKAVLKFMDHCLRMGHCCNECIYLNHDKECAISSGDYGDIISKLFKYCFDNVIRWE